jgi:hypothetical protein
MLRKNEGLEELLNQFNPILRMIFTNLGLPSKNLQQGAALSLTKVIQNAPLQALQATLSFINGKLLDHLTSSGGLCKSHAQILESIISLVLAVEQTYNPHCEAFLPVLMDLISQNNASG